MLKKYKNLNTLACFSPPVMIATFFIEILLALYIVWRYSLTPVTRIAVALLLCLATFQLAEYNVCEGSFGLSSIDWARIGFVAIALLPPIGIHLATQMAGAMGKQKYRRFVYASYAAAAAFAVVFLGTTYGMKGETCTGNYVIFHVNLTTMWLFALYYYGLLVAGIALTLHYARGFKSNRKKRAQYALAVGYLAFLVPTTTVNIIDPSTMAGIPSIMCGFAVLLALILAGYVLPFHYKK